MSFLRRKEKALKRRAKKKVQLSPLQRQLIWGAVLFLMVALVIFAVWHVTRIASFQIEHVEIVGGETIPHERIEEIAQTALNGTYFHLIPKRFLLFYPKRALEEQIHTLDRVKHVQVERVKDQSILIVFEEYIPHALWCHALEEDSCLFMDHTGFAFSEAPALKGSAFVRYIEEDTPPQEGVAGFESGFIKGTQTFISRLEEELDLYVTHVRKHGSYDVDYVISGGGLIKVSQSIPMDDSFQNLQTILLSDEFAHISPGSFQYIDLRFGEKIFVNEEIASPETDVATSTDAAPVDLPGE